jgi:hypothetical protein
VDEQFVVILFNRVIRSFTVMAPVRQKIREVWEEKSSKSLESKILQISFEINHLCFDHCGVHIIFLVFKVLYECVVHYMLGQ